MKRSVAILVVALTVLSLWGADASAQGKWIVGGRLGMSLYTVSVPSYNYYYGTSSSTSSTSAGLQIGFTGEYLFNKQMGVGSEFNINTQAGTPIEWATFFKMYFLIKGSDIRPYADGGFNLFFVTGGPYFGIRFGGGALFKIAKNLYIPADLQLGLVFPTGATVFYLAVTSGIRYEI
jgi:hypothetical protein